MYPILFQYPKSFVLSSFSLFSSFAPITHYPLLSIQAPFLSDHRSSSVLVKPLFFLVIPAPLAFRHSREGGNPEIKKPKHNKIKKLKIFYCTLLYIKMVRIHKIELVLLGSRLRGNDKNKSYGNDENQGARE